MMETDSSTYKFQYFDMNTIYTLNKLFETNASAHDAQVVYQAEKQVRPAIKQTICERYIKRDIFLGLGCEQKK